MAIEMTKCEKCGKYYNKMSDAVCPFCGIAQSAEERLPEEPVTTGDERSANTETRKVQTPGKCNVLLAGIIAVMVVIALLVIGRMYLAGREKAQEVSQNTSIAASDETEVPEKVIQKNREELQELADEYLEQICKYREGNQLGESLIDEKLYEAAGELAESCAEEGLITAEKPGELCESLASTVLQQYECPNAAWMVVYTSGDGTAETAFAQLDGEMFGTAMKNCDKIGISVSRDAQGYLYWIYVAQ